MSPPLESMADPFNDGWSLTKVTAPDGHKAWFRNRQIGEPWFEDGVEYVKFESMNMAGKDHCIITCAKTEGRNADS